MPVLDIARHDGTEAGARLRAVLGSATAEVLVERYTALSQSLFLEMFGDPVTNPKEWEISNLDGVTAKITDGEHQNPPIAESGNYLIMAKDVLEDRVSFAEPRYVSHDNYIKYTKKCNPEIGDVLIVSRGATVGRCTVVKSDLKFCLMGSVILIKPNELILGCYLNQLLKNSNFSKKLINVSSASAQQAIYISHLKQLNIPVPSIKLQNLFAEHIQLIEAQKQQAQRSLEKSEALFNSLLQRAFTGELTQA
jgi:type I restriction enzyme S subunit